MSRAWKLGLIAGFITQLLLILFVTVIGLHQMRDTEQRLQNIVANDVRKLLLSKAMHSAARERMLSLLRVIENEDPFLRDDEIQRFHELATDFILAREEFAALPLNAVESNLLARQAELTAQARPLQDRVAELAKHDDMATARSLMLEQALPTQDAVLKVLGLLDRQTHRAAELANRQAREESEAARTWMLWFSGGALLLGLSVAGVVIFYTQRANHERERLATHDTLTGLPNRMLFMDRLGQGLVRAHRHGESMGVMFIDLDRFKIVNDTLGHAAGDELIRQVSGRLRNAVRAEDIVARLGGDEFVVALTEIHKVDNILLVLEKILADITQPYQISGRELFTSCSIGVSVYPDDGDNAQALLKNADTAMYHAKAHGRNRFQLYNTAMNARAEERLELETDIHHALERDEFEWHYQPQLNLETGRIHGVEALVRWRHPSKGLLSPARFLELLDETGLIIELGQRMLRKACTQCARWHAEGHANLSLAVNLSGKEFWHEDLLDTVHRALAHSALPAQALHLELTEDILMQDIDRAVGKLQTLKALGVRVAVDDFGTGYSSLGHLKRFPVDALKIDRLFVKDIAHDHVDAALVGSILALCEGLQLDAVAEGVEEPAQLDRLQNLGCRVVQGYLISPPVPAEAIGELLAGDWSTALSTPIPAAEPPLDLAPLPPQSLAAAS